MPTRPTKSKWSAAKVARGAVITALGVSLLLLSYLFESLDLVVSSMAAILIWMLRLEYGASFALTVYTATAVLGFILAPGASGVICYGIIFGWYPVVKVIIERRIHRKAPAMLLKMLVVTLAFALMLAVFFNLFIGDMTFESLAEEFSSFFSLDGRFSGWFNEKTLFGVNRIQWMLIIAYLVFAPLITLIYDLLLSKFALVYIYKLRPILVKAHIFGDRSGKY